MKRTALALSLALSLVAGFANAAAPTVTDLYPNYSFAEYSGTAKVGEGDVNTNSVLFYIDEKFDNGLKSWYIFFEPEISQRVRATIHFDRPIDSVLTTRAALALTNGDYGSGSVVYGDSLLIGLEPLDTTTWMAGGKDLTIDWVSSTPGDHMRVLVAIPEPANYALFGVGLLTLGAVLRRRRQD